MIGIKYPNGNNRIMEDRLIISNEDSDGDAIECNTEGPIVPSSTRKPSLLRSQLLRRTTTRTKKRPPETVGTTMKKEECSGARVETTTDAPVSAAVVVEPHTISPTRDSKEEDQPYELHHVHHNAEFELKNGATNYRDDATRDDANCSLDISIIESEDEDSGVEVSLIEHDDESKSEVEVEVEVGPSQQIREEKRQQPTKTATPSAVATPNLSIVVTGSDIVVEYRDDSRGECKEPSPPATPSSLRQPPAPRRPKGIMKRPRHSGITYHHPRRPLPPPLPPPGYRENNNLSPKSCATATSIDSGSSSLNHYPPMKKRVSFNERELTEQYKMSRLRRKLKYEKRRSFLGILSMAMPVVMPYIMAVLILVASSMVPLPTDQKYQQQRQERSMSVPTDLANGSNFPKPVQPPIFIDVGSRMWDERRKTKEASRRRTPSASI